MITTSRMLESAIDEVLKKDTKTKELFLGDFARDELPQKVNYPSCLVFNTQPRSQRGQHWLALFYDKNGHWTSLTHLLCQLRIILWSLI